MARYSTLKRYYITGGPKGFGYQIVDKGENLKSHRRIFHTSCREQAKAVFETIEENDSEFPEPKTDWIPKVLVIKEKHGDQHFLIKKVGDLNDVAYNYIKANHEGAYSQFTKWDVPTDLVIIDKDIIKVCPSPEARKVMTDQNTSNQRNLKSYSEHNALIDEVDALMAKDSTKGAYTLLHELEFLYSYCDLETFGNLRHL